MGIGGKPALFYYSLTLNNPASAFPISTLLPIESLMLNAMAMSRASSTHDLWAAFDILATLFVFAFIPH